jgi:peptide deformylase
VAQLIEQVQRLLDGPRPLPLVLAGDPVLRTPASAYEFSLPAALQTELLAAMQETMHAAPGVGLAAPQIGLGIQLAVLEDPATLPADIAAERQRYPLPLRVLVNPGYTAVDMAAPDGVAEFYEGCLSVPGYQAVVPRASVVRLRCLNEHGDAVDELVTGWAARIVAHETDHLGGVIYLDRAFTRSLTTTGNLIDRWSGTPLPVIRERLHF